MLFRALIGFFAIFPAALVAYAIGSVASTQFVLLAHAEVYPIDVTSAERLAMTLYDVGHMWLYFAIIVIGFLIAFPIAAGLKRLLPGLAGIASPLAGAAAIGSALGLMLLCFGIVPISGARSTLGFATQLLAGAIGGYVFALLAVRRADTALAAS